MQDRVDIWLDPWPDSQRRRASRSSQAWFALAWGGVTGTGLGLGNPDRIPVVETDFIFAAIGEELGLLGATAVLIALPADRRLRPAHRACAPSRRSRSCSPPASPPSSACRRSSSSAGVTRLLPLTGVTLPFVSYGGSSLVANYVLLALLLRISDDTATRRRGRRRRQGRADAADATRVREPADPPPRRSA